MKYTFISRLYYLNTSYLHKGKQIIDNLRLSKSSKLVDELFYERDIVPSIGTLEYNYLKKGNFIYAEGDFNELKHKLKKLNENNSFYFLEYFMRLAQMFSTALWFVKDNSINTELGFIVIDNKISSNSRSAYFSNAKGECEDTTFSNDELDKAIEITKIFKEIDMGDDWRREIVEEQFNKSNRIERAMYFLQSARATSFLPSKIALYCIMLETLLTTDNKELSHKIAERTARILGEDYNERKNFYDIVKNAYNVRSSVFHGQLPPSKFKKTESIINLSIQIDEVIRNLLTKIILKHDLREKFLLNNDELEKWFTELILQ